MSRTRRLGLVLAALAVLGAAVFGAFVHREMTRAMQRPLQLSQATLLRIEPGHNVMQVARRVEAEGWVPDRRLFALRARLDGVAHRIQAGTYELAPGDTLTAFLARIVAGDTKVFQITFVEGWRFSDVRRALAAQPYLTHTVAAMSDEDVARRLDLPVPSPEGRFFPATYDYADGTRDLDILARAAERMHRILAAAWSERGADLPYADPDEALIMASIIEKETGRADERRRIAGVFVRRLRARMKLQTDPTVIYGLGAAFDGDLTRADLVRDTPYNTYTRTGLPPTPIAMPGRAAIEAALDPAPGTALYFVATGDGGHHFSESLDEHNRAVRRFQLGR